MVGARYTWCLIAQAQEDHRVVPVPVQYVAKTHRSQGSTTRGPKLPIWVTSRAKRQPQS